MWPQHLTRHLTRLCYENFSHCDPLEPQYILQFKKQIILGGILKGLRVILIQLKEYKNPT